ncbi:hypothetical protein HPB49_005696 [Dermacentor silvarum]|uniref:Uncharacterized protein n=1 Tax=Dermacentor silvarum TaxID=543639 RepID=A0ACB8C2A9_DERSI|nr:hypothetical protein HPB49_005696 [Dermacentor silvarum]
MACRRSSCGTYSSSNKREIPTDVFSRLDLPPPDQNLYEGLKTAFFQHLGVPVPEISDKLRSTPQFPSTADASERVAQPTSSSSPSSLGESLAEQTKESACAPPELHDVHSSSHGDRTAASRALTAGGTHISAPVPHEILRPHCGETGPPAITCTAFPNYCSVFPVESLSHAPSRSACSVYRLQLPKDTPLTFGHNDASSTCSARRRRTRVQRGRQPHCLSAFHRCVHPIFHRCQAGCCYRALRKGPLSAPNCSRVRLTFRRWHHANLDRAGRVPWSRACHHGRGICGCRTRCGCRPHRGLHRLASPNWDKSVNGVTLAPSATQVADKLARDFDLKVGASSYLFKGHLKLNGQVCKGVINVREEETSASLKPKLFWREGDIAFVRKLGTTNVALVTFVGRRLPRYIHYNHECIPVRAYKTTTPACYRCGTIGHRVDNCPHPDDGSSGFCGQQVAIIPAGLNEHECKPICMICGGAHLMGSTQCTGKFRKLRRPVSQPGGATSKQRQRTDQLPRDRKLSKSGQAPQQQPSKTDKPGQVAHQKRTPKNQQ